MKVLENDEIMYLILVIFLTVASYTDLKYSKIYNLWILMAGVLAVFVSGYSFFIWAGISILCTFILYMFRMVGASDIKLVAFIYGILGPGSASIIVFMSLSIASVYAAYLLISRKNLYSRLIYFKNFVNQCIESRSIKKYYDIKNNDKSLTMPLAPWFLIAFIIWRIYDLCKVA